MTMRAVGATFYFPNDVLRGLEIVVIGTILAFLVPGALSLITPA
jgi:hypothetical protein